MPEPRQNRRAKQADQTRTEILQAARRLFAEQGYSRTTVKDIAAAAGVSAQTVYDSIGSKRRLVLLLDDFVSAEAGVAEIVAHAFATEDAAVLIETAARVTRAIVEKCGDIVRGADSGAEAEPELAELLAEGKRSHQRGAARLVARLDQLQALRPGLSTDDAADSIAVITDTSFALMLADQYGWSFDRIEAWMIDSCRRLVLADPLEA